MAFPLSSRSLKYPLFPWQKEAESTATPMLALEASACKCSRHLHSRFPSQSTACPHCCLRGQRGTIPRSICRAAAKTPTPAHVRSQPPLPTLSLSAHLRQSKQTGLLRPIPPLPNPVATLSVLLPDHYPRRSSAQAHTPADILHG